jgi:putative redox protein
MRPPENQPKEFAMAAQIKAVVRQVSGSTSEASARQHKSYVDRPEAKGGTDRGPMGGELMLMGIGGCFMSNLLAAAKADGMAVTDLAVDLAATMADDAPSRFTDIALVVSGGCADRDALGRIVAAAEKNCISVNTVRGAVRLTVTLA